MCVVYGIAYGLVLLLYGLSVVFLRQQRYTTQRGNSRAARKSILPSFEPMLWMFCGVSGVFAAYLAISMSLAYAGPGRGYYQCVYDELLYQGLHFNLVFIGIFIYQKSVSLPAMMRSLILTLGALTFPVLCLLTLSVIDTHSQHAWIYQAQYGIICCTRVISCFFFLVMYCWPISRANIRVLRQLACYALTFYSLGFVYGHILYQSRKDSSVNVALEHIGIYVLIASLAWISLTPMLIWKVLKADTEYWRGVGERMCCLSDECGPHHVNEVVSAEGFHLMVEMHRQHVIDFTNLEWNGRLRNGGSASVYKGLLNSHIPVAIKMYSPQEITEDVVYEFSQEAAFWCILDHPNIVTFHGLCVCPPSICLVSELCRGSLSDLLRATPQLSLVVQLCYMLDAARAVAYLHSFSPPLLHRDIKASNFLLDAHNNVKLSDFGESRVAAVPHEKAMSVRGTLEYMAPEMLNGKQGHANYSTSSDVYSLAITFWDILHPQSNKYRQGDKNHMHIFEMVVNGSRPAIHNNIPQPLRDLLENAWQTDALQRSSAATIVQHIEVLLKEASGPILQKLIASSHASSGTSWTGVELSEMLMSMESVVNDRQEAARVGNALMDVGFLHDTKHTTSFKVSGQHHYTIKQSLRRKSFPFFREADTQPITCLCKLKGQGFQSRVQQSSVAVMFGTRRKKKRVKSALSIELLSDTTDDNLWHDWNLRDTSAISI